MMHTNYNNIVRSDIFFSWTGKDKDIKNQIKEYLSSDVCNYSCIDSEERCAGDFEKWSLDGVTRGEIVLLVITDNLFQSGYVPLELTVARAAARRAALARKDENWENAFAGRILPVWCCEMDASREFTERKHLSVEKINEKCPGLNITEEELVLTPGVFSKNDRNSYFDATKYMEHGEISREGLEAIAERVHTLLSGRVLQILEGRSEPRVKAHEDKAYTELSLPRILKRKVETESDAAVTPADIAAMKNAVVYIQGEPGAGKSEVINQIDAACEGEAFRALLRVDCATSFRKIVDNPDGEGLYNVLFSAVQSMLNWHSFSKGDFDNLINKANVIIALDGLDEVPAAVRPKFNKAVGDFFRKHSQNKEMLAVITSRNDDKIVIDERENISLSLPLFTQVEQEKYIENYFTVYDCLDKKQEFLRKVGDMMAADRIKNNAYYLEQLIMIFISEADTEVFPESEVEIFDFTLSKLLQGEKVDDYKKLLAEYAYLLHTTDEMIDARWYKNTCQELEVGEEDRKFLMDRRIIMENRKFGHSLMEEYLTAWFLLHGELEDRERLVREMLVNDYDDDRWKEVIRFYLEMADAASNIRKDKVTPIISDILTEWEGKEPDYALLLEATRGMRKKGESVRKMLVKHILLKSAEGTYPFYGPLFWYVPHYDTDGDMYRALMGATAEIMTEGNPNACTALLLVRDLCVIYLMVGDVEEVTGGDCIDRDKAMQILSEGLVATNPRLDLCELFYTKQEITGNGEMVEPWFFNTQMCRQHTGKYSEGYEIGEYRRFSDEFFEESVVPAYGKDEAIGLVVIPNEMNKVSGLVPKKSRKITGLVMRQTDKSSVEYLNFYLRNLQAVFYPMNVSTVNAKVTITYMTRNCHDFWIYNGRAGYFPNHVVDFTNSEWPNNSELFKTWPWIREIKTKGNIPKYAFQEDKYIEKVIIGGERVGKFAFNGCHELKEVIFKKNVVEIEEGAFVLCQSLEQIKIPEEINCIAPWTFMWCFHLKTLELPEGLEEIGEKAFMSCELLKDIKWPKSLKKVWTDSFEYEFENTLPDGVVLEKSKPRDIWDFANIMKRNNELYVEPTDELKWLKEAGNEPDKTDEYKLKGTEKSVVLKSGIRKLIFNHRIKYDSAFLPVGFADIELEELRIEDGLLRIGGKSIGKNDLYNYHAGSNLHIQKVFFNSNSKIITNQECKWLDTIVDSLYIDSSIKIIEKFGIFSNCMKWPILEFTLKIESVYISSDTCFCRQSFPNASKIIFTDRSLDEIVESEEKHTGEIDVVIDDEKVQNWREIHRLDYDRVTAVHIKGNGAFAEKLIFDLADYDNLELIDFSEFDGAVDADMLKFVKHRPLTVRLRPNSNLEDVIRLRFSDIAIEIVGGNSGET